MVVVEVPLIKGGVQSSYDERELHKPISKDIMAPIVCEYHSEKWFLRTEVIREKVKLWDLSGFEKLLMEGEKFKKTWSPHTSQEEFKTNEAFVLP